jgi:hypothetical protein
MRILCDQNVASTYRTAFEQAESITVATVAERLSHDAPDAEIAAYATDHDWVVFTNDDDFYTESLSHGLLLYDQLEDPTPGVILEAIEAIEARYERPDEIAEYVPDGWVR